MEATVILVRGSAFQLPFHILHLGFGNVLRTCEGERCVLGLRKGGPCALVLQRDPCPRGPRPSSFRRPSRMSMATFFALCANYDRE